MNSTRIQLCLMGPIAGLLFSACNKEPSSASGRGPGGMAVQVVAVAATRQPVAETLDLIGSVAANEMVEIKAESAGIVEEFLFEEGQPVGQGDLLIRLDRTKLQSSVEEAQANYKLSQSNFQRSEKLFNDRLESQQEFDASRTRAEADRALLELRKRQLKDAQVLAPFAGVIGARQVSPGQVISRDQTLTWLVNLDPVKVEFNVPERFLSVCEVDQSIEVRVAAFPEQKFQGVVYFIAPFIDPDTRTVQIKARVPNPKGLLKPGMFATLTLTLTIRENSIVIPEAAIYRPLGDNRATVYTIDSESKAQLRTIEIGERMQRNSEVLSGLEEGEMVIVEGYQKLGPGSTVKLASKTEDVQKNQGP